MRSSRICSWEPVTQESQWYCFNPRLKAWYTGEPVVEALETQVDLIFSSNPKIVKDWCLRSSIQTGGVPSFLCSFCSILTFNWLGEVDSYLRGQSALFSLANHVLIASKNILNDAPIIMFDQISGFSIAHASWHVKLTITTIQKLLSLMTYLPCLLWFYIGTSNLTCQISTYHHFQSYSSSSIAPNSKMITWPIQLLTLEPESHLCILPFPTFPKSSISTNCNS